MTNKEKVLLPRVERLCARASFLQWFETSKFRDSPEFGLSERDRALQ